METTNLDPAFQIVTEAPDGAHVTLHPDPYLAAVRYAYYARLGGFTPVLLDGGDGSHDVRIPGCTVCRFAPAMGPHAAGGFTPIVQHREYTRRQIGG